MLPWMEFLNASGSTCRVDGLPLASWLRVASLWQARHSSAVGLGGCFFAAAEREALASRENAQPDASALTQGVYAGPDEATAEKC